MKRKVLVVGLLLCALAVIGVAGAAAYAPPPDKQSLSPGPGYGPYPYAYGGKITALRPPVSEWGVPGGPADKRQMPAPKSPFALPTFGTDVNISGGNETFIAANPANPLNFIAGANSTGRFTTTDGGATWLVGSLNSGGDPAGAFDSTGNAYFAALGNTSSCPDNPYIYKSTNGGINWTGPVLPLTDPSPSDHFFDKEWITVDNNPTSPYFGRIYYTASDFHTPAGCNLNAYIDVAEKLVYSSDQGATWSTPVNINDASHNQDQFTNPMAARDGTLYVGYQYQNCTFNCTSSLPMVNLIAKSTNGGVSFSPSITITNQPISPTGAFSGGYQYLLASSTASGFRHNDQAIIGVSPTNANQVYALWTDGRWDTSFVYQGITGQHADIAFSRSTDGGNTWSAPIRVNDDPQGNGKDQFFPWMTVGTNGVIHASWSDRRDSPTGFQYREYYSQSSDGGLTWAANIPVADVGGTPSTFIGDYSGLAVNSDNTLVLPIWTDMRSGQRAYTDRGVMPAGTATPTFTPCANCTATRTRTVGPTNTPTQCSTNYVCTVVPGSTIVSGTTDTGNHGDDVVTSVNLPFPVTLYSASYTTANVSSNGNLQFTTQNTAFTNSCLPNQTMGPAIFPYWDDLRTDTTGSCTPGPCGVYTSISGSAPNRTFYIEWRAFYFSGSGSANFEISLHEDRANFEVIEGVLDGGGTSATVGVQDGGTRYTECECDTGIPSNMTVVFTLGTCGSVTVTPVSTMTRTNTPSGSTPTRTSTPCGTGGGWAAGPSMPSPLVRGVGVWYTNGLNRFYVMGGRSSDSAGSDLQNPRYYDPASNTWTSDNAASFADNQVNNMACASLMGPGVPWPRIYCVGGSAAGATTATSAVRMYDPNTHTITALSSDDWPAPASTLPGGFAVVNNKLYILGGFTINVSMSRQIWQFDPNASAGSRWTLKTALVPDPGSGSNGLGYIPTTAVGNYIYTGGGSMWAAGTVADTQIAFRYDPTNDVVDDNAVPDLPSPGSAETRALTMNGKVWLMGGGRTAPNPSAEVKQFDPANPGAGWTIVTSFATARRNFPVDVNPASGKIYLAGGYGPTTATDSMEIYTAPQPCGTATRTPTPGRTMTATPNRTGTPMRTGTPRPSVTPCGDCAIEMLAVVTSCYQDGTVHWIAIAHNPDQCMVQAPWRAELQVRNNGGNYRTVRIQYATSNFMPGDTVWDGYFCYHFSSNVRDMRVEVLYEDQAGRSVSPGSNDKVQERGAPANMYSATPDSGIPVAKNGTGDSPTQCDADMASHPMAPCQSNDSCSPPPSPVPTGVSTRAPVLPTK